MKAIPRNLGTAAGIAAVSLILHSAVGALWGLLRPAYRGTLADGGQVLIDAGAANVEFASFASFVVATGLLATLVSLSAYVASPATRGPAMLWWLVGVALVSAYAFLQIGALTAGMLHDIGDPHLLSEGDPVSLVPGLDPGVGWLVAPFLAALAYWCSALVTPATEAESLPIQ